MSNLNTLKASATPDITVSQFADGADIDDVDFTSAFSEVDDNFDTAAASVQVSNGDTHVKDLESALTAGGGIAIAKTNSGANETLEISTDISVAAPNQVAINGSMLFAQQGAQKTDLDHGDMLVDLFKWHELGALDQAVIKFDHLTDAPNPSGTVPFVNASMRLTVTTPETTLNSDEYCGIRYPIEGFSYREIAQRQFTIAFWVKSSLAGTYCVALHNSNADRHYVAEYTIDTTNTWELKTITVTASPSAGTWDYVNGLGLNLYFSLSCGADYNGATDGVWASGTAQFATSNQASFAESSNATFSLSLLAIAPGSSTPVFTLPDYSAELMRVYRYYRRYTGGTIADSDHSLLNLIQGIASTDNMRFIERHPVPMRVAPSFLMFGLGPNNGIEDAERSYRLGDGVVVYEANFEESYITKHVTHVKFFYADAAPYETNFLYSATTTDYVEWDATL